nr:hypothetical protein [bacterium]
MENPGNPEPKKKPFLTTLWVSSTYFAEGLPYMVVRFMSSVFFTDMGVREALLGFVNFFGIPWNLKFLWAPLLDIFGTKRGWMIRIQLAITLFIFLIALLAGFHASSGSTALLQTIAFVFVGLAFISATNDIAIDAYYLEGLTTREDQAAYSGLRVMAYRIAIIYARSVLVAVAGFANWFWGFSAGAMTMLVFLLIHKFLLPRFEAERERKAMTFAEFRKSVAESFLSYMRQERFLVALLFIASYKLGDEILFSMNTPFLMRELGVTKPQLAWLAGFVGSVAAIAGAMIGAWWVKKVGLKKSIWPITILMNVNILAYVLLSELLPQASTLSGITLIAIIHGYENVAAGLGTAALMIYLMRLCSAQYKAAHFAIGTAIMSVGATFIGGFGGLIVEAVGYTCLFVIGFIAAIPSMVMLFF